MLNTAVNRVARSDRRLPNGNIIFQTIASWLSLRDSTWQTIPAVISFDLQSHWPHWILYFFGQVLKPNFLICKDISHIHRIKLLVLRRNNHKRSQILALRPLSFFLLWGPFAILIHVRDPVLVNLNISPFSFALKRLLRLLAVNLTGIKVYAWLLSTLKYLWYQAE